MPIFDPAIFDGTLGGFIFDDGGVAPAPPGAAIRTITVKLADTNLSLKIADIIVPLNVEGE